MASVNLFSLLTPKAPKGKGINSINLDTQFDTGVPALTNLTALGDSISTTLDAPAGAALGYQAIGFNILSGHTLNMGAGNDTLSVKLGSAVGAVGLKIGTNSVLDLGVGNDSVVIALTGDGSVGIDNQSTILGGAGLDSVGADGILHGIVNGTAAFDPTTGAPILSTAVINMGAGADKMSATSLTGNGIENYGTITMGLNTEADKDVLTGGSAGHGVLTPAFTPGHFGIYNTGTINMGGGKDVVDALVGGFGGGGTYNLGFAGDKDADAVLGFGSGTFNGGGGRNTISLPDGTYNISYTTANGHKPIALTDLASGAVTRAGNVEVMTFNQFDGIGGTGINAGLHFFAPALVGTGGLALTSFTVNTAGDISAANYVA
jgi:hypothetical protein